MLGTSLTAARQIATNRHWTVKDSDLAFIGARGKLWLKRWQIDPQIGAFRRFVLFFHGQQLIRIKAYFREVADVAATRSTLLRRYGNAAWIHKGTHFWVRNRQLGVSLHKEIGLLQWVDVRYALRIGLLGDAHLKAPTPSTRPVNSPTSKPKKS